MTLSPHASKLRRKRVRVMLQFYENKRRSWGQGNPRHHQTPEEEFKQYWAWVQAWTRACAQIINKG